MLFENCLIQAPDGTNISRCSKRKQEWYINNNLAYVINQDPMTIRLTFEPKGRCSAPDPLLLYGKPNLCVVCGITDDLTRHHIIPYSFSKHFPMEIKLDMIHDIMPLCRSCHDDYEIKSFEKRKELSAKYQVPLTGIDEDKIRRVRKARSAAHVLLNHKFQVPKERQDTLMKIVCEFLGNEEVTSDDLNKLKMHKVEYEPDYKNFCQFVVNQINFDDFAKEWRTHFIESMKPKYMPEEWQIDRKTCLDWSYRFSPQD